MPIDGAPRLRGVRPGLVLTGDEPVRVGDHDQALSVYAERLENTAEMLVALYRQVPEIDPQAIVKAMCCGRIISRRGREPYQRCHYCRQPRICPACHLLHATNHADEFIDDLVSVGGKKVVFDLMFSLPPPADATEEARQLRFARTACSNLLDYRKRWNDDPDHLATRKRMLKISLSIHPKPVSPGGLVMPHLHGVLVAEPGLLLRDIKSRLQAWWEDVTDTQFGRPGKAMLERLGPLVAVTQPRRSHAREPFTLAHLKNKLIYNARVTKKGESLADTVRRYKLLDDLGIKRTTTRSRKLQETGKRRYLPHEYDPESLSHDRMCVIGLGGRVFADRPVHDYAPCKAKLREQLDELLSESIESQEADT